MQTVTHNGVNYRIENENVVNDNTNLVVCTSLASEIASAAGIVIAQRTIESAHRIDPHFLNMLIQKRIQK